MKILITGGAGYIGSALAIKLANQKEVDEVVIYDTLSRGDFGLFINQKSNNKITFTQANILDNHSLANVMKSCDIVYHLAAKVVTPDSDNDSQQFEQVNNWGTAAVVNEATKANVSVFINLSSVYVYGQGEGKKTVADHPTPNSFYGISKLRGEEHLLALPSSIKQFNIRSGSVYGYSPSTRFDVIINQLLFQAHYFNKVAIHGQGDQIRPFIHIDKLVQSLAQIPTSTLENGTYNLIEHNASVNHIVDDIKKIYPELDYNYVNRHIKMKDIMISASPELIKTLPWEPKSFSEEMKEFSQIFW